MCPTSPQWHETVMGGPFTWPIVLRLRSLSLAVESVTVAPTGGQTVADFALEVLSV
jgi:hypothetical protein